MKRADLEMSLLWVLNLADGENSLLDMASARPCPFRIAEAAARLVEAGLLIDVPT